MALINNLTAYVKDDDLQYSWAVELQRWLVAFGLKAARDNKCHLFSSLILW